MMRKILVVVGSGKLHGNTNQLSDEFIMGALETGHQVKKVNLTENIQGCKGCGVCQNNGHHCVIRDMMKDIYPLFDEADTIVMASPLYFWSLSARLKSFIDRLYAISTDDEYPKKDTVLLMTSGSDEFYAFEQAVSFYRFFIKALGWKDQGMVLAGSCITKQTETAVKEHFLNEAYCLGKRI
jgi:multimeric flavodoxin WrbA